MKGILLTLMILGFFAIGLKAGSYPELETADLKRVDGKVVIQLTGIGGVPIEPREFHHSEVQELIEIDLPGVLFRKPILTRTHTIPGFEFFRVQSLSQDPPVIRLTLFTDIKNREKIVPYIEKGQLFLTGAPSDEAPYSSEIPLNPYDLEKLDLDFDNTELATILNALSIKMGLTLITDSGVKGQVSIHTANSSVKDILDALLLSRGFKYSLSGNRLTVISPRKPAYETMMAKELIFKDLSLKDALQTISRMLNVNVIIHESVKDKNINFYIENLPLEELFDLLLRTNGLIKKEYNKNTFIILDNAKSSSFGELIYRTYKLVNTTPSLVQSTISSISDIKKKVNVSNWAVDEKLNQIIAFDTPEAHSIIEKIIKSTDEKPRQVVIEMKLLEISKTGAKDLGFEMINGLAMNPNNTFPRNLDIKARVSFLESTDNAKVLASPKIRALNKEPASIHIGETIPVPFTEYAIGTVSSAGTVTPGSVSPVNTGQIATQEIKRFKDVPVGIQLNVTPEIFRDGEVELDININVDTVLSISPEGQIRKSIKTTQTRIRVKDGETVVFGGLIQQKDSQTMEAPPFLNKWPIISSLFRKRKDVQDSELVLLLTPHFVGESIEGIEPKVHP